METTKPKRILSEKQKANLAKGLASLKAKREAKKSEIKSIEIDDEPDVKLPEPEPVKIVKIKPESEPVKIKPEPIPVKVKEDALPHLPIKYLTKEDLHEFKNDLLSTLYPPQTPVEEVKIRKPKKKSIAFDDESITQRQHNVPKSTNKSERALLSGYALLDALLNR